MAHLYVGTYTHGESEGVYLCEFNPKTGSVTGRTVAAEINNPTFLAISPDRQTLFSITGPGDESGSGMGYLSAYSIDSETGALTYINKQPSRGVGPCHLTVDTQGSYLLAANYASGTVAMLPIASDGSLREATGFVQHQGSGPNMDRQEGPHAHSITLDHNDNFAFAAALGPDKILAYTLDRDGGLLTPNNPPSISLAGGQGPRHFDFHPSEKYAYAINEMGNTVTAFEYDGINGSLEEIQTIPTIPPDFKDSTHCADIHVSPNGKFLYGSNRGHDSIVIFKIAETGRLTLIGYESTGGETPRNFMIDPSGDFMLVANQDTNTIVSFCINQSTGELEPTGDIADVPNPVCLKLL